MRILIISDIHNRIQRAQSIIDSVAHDKCILLGDYFDSHSESPDDAKNTALWLREKVLSNSNIVPLIGNHDTQYIYNFNSNLRCSGFGHEKNIDINNILNESDKELFKFYHIEQGFVFIHAGLTNPLWKILSLNFTEKGYKTKLEFFDAVLAYHVYNGIKSAKQGHDVGLFNAGWDRNGFERYGGINWVDWDSFSPINGINQIVGHSINRVPEILVQRKGGGISKKNVIDYYKKPYHGEVLSVTYALDTCNNHYMVIDGGEVNIFDFQTGINLKELNRYYIPESNLNTLS
jgi:hypothetical protein